MIFLARPKFRNAKYSFICNDNGNIINEYKTLKENGIKDGYLILMNEEKKMEMIISDNSKIEEKKLKVMANKLKEEAHIDVVISAKDTKNLITIKFQSVNQHINCYAICSEKDIFNNVANKIFEKNQNLKSMEIFSYAMEIILMFINLYLKIILMTKMLSLYMILMIMMNK